MNANPHHFRDRELLECVGGPHDGRQYAVSLLFPPPLDAPNTGVKFTDGSVYELDGERRKWVYAGKGKG